MFKRSSLSTPSFLLPLVAASLFFGCGTPLETPLNSASDTLTDNSFFVEAPLPAEQEAKPNRYLVAFHADAPDWVKPHLGRKIMKEPLVYIVKPPDKAFIERLKADAAVRFCEAEQHYDTPLTRVHKLSSEQLARLSAKSSAGFGLKFTPNDSEYDLQWNMRAIQMEDAWDINQEAQDIIVAVIDSGVDPDHPDLQSNLLPLEDIWGEFSGSDRLIGRTSRRILDFAGRDGNGHGTHVAGVIGAVLNNAEGVAGIAGGRVKILPIKVTNLQGETSSGLMVEALQRAIAKNARVINLSIGAIGAGSGISQSLKLVLDEALGKGIVIVAASGNESKRSQNTVADVTLPASYPGVISVGSFLQSGNVADYSNGGETLDLLAPGGSGFLSQGGFPVVSTWPTYPAYEYLTQRVSTLSYAGISGTSMAAPHVSGVVALMLAQEPELTPQQVRSRLIATATDMGPKGFDTTSGYGSLNARKALAAKGDGPRL